MNRNGFNITQVGYGHWLVKTEYRGREIKRIVTDSQLIDNAKSETPTKWGLAALKRKVREG